MQAMNVCTRDLTCIFVNLQILPSYMLFSIVYLMIKKIFPKLDDHF